MTSNFLLFNPTAANQLSDLDYSSDSSRSGGLVDGVAETALFNKAWYQFATMVYAIAKMLSDAGETISDSDVAALQVSLEKILKKASGVNALSGTSYTVVTGDRNLLIESANSSAVAVSLPQAGSTGFDRNFKFSVQNNGTGLLTITPATSTIDGAASITLAQGQGVDIYSDDTNYFTQRGRGIFSKSFESSQQSITSGGTLTIAHGLGKSPFVVQGFLVCTTANNGFSIGDILLINPGEANSSASADRGQSITFDSTNIYVTFGGAYTVINKTTGNGVNISGSQWQFFIRAVA